MPDTLPADEPFSVTVPPNVASVMTQLGSAVNPASAGRSAARTGVLAAGKVPTSVPSPDAVRSRARMKLLLPSPGAAYRRNGRLSGCNDIAEAAYGGRASRIHSHAPPLRTATRVADSEAGMPQPLWVQPATGRPCGSISRPNSFIVKQPVVAAVGVRVARWWTTSYDQAMKSGRRLGDHGVRRGSHRQGDQQNQWQKPPERKGAFRNHGLNVDWWAGARPLRKLTDS